MIFLLVMGLGTLASLSFWTHMKGRADARFKRNLGEIRNPPYVIGMLTSWLWPLQIAAAAVAGVVFLAYRSGTEEGLALDLELHGLREIASDLNVAMNRTLKMLMDSNLDPHNLDDQTVRALTARSIEWTMEDEAKTRREKAAAGPAMPSVRKTKTPVFNDAMFDILDSHGVAVDTPEYREYRKHAKGELDLS